MRQSAFVDGPVLCERTGPLRPTLNWSKHL